MRLDPTVQLGLRISASKSASWFEKRTTFDPQKLFWGCGMFSGTLFKGFEPKKFGSRDMASGDFGSPIRTPGAKIFFAWKSRYYVGTLGVVCLALFQLLFPWEHVFRPCHRGALWRHNHYDCAHPIFIACYLLVLAICSNAPKKIFVTLQLNSANIYFRLTRTLPFGVILIYI